VLLGAGALGARALALGIVLVVVRRGDRGRGLLDRRGLVGRRRGRLLGRRVLGGGDRLDRRRGSGLRRRRRGRLGGLRGRRRRLVALVAQHEEGTGRGGNAETDDREQRPLALLALHRRQRERLADRRDRRALGRRRGNVGR